MAQVAITLVYRYLPLSDKQVFSTRPVCARWYIWLLHMGGRKSTGVQLYGMTTSASDLRSQSLELHAAHQAMAATLERPDEAPSKNAVGIASLPYTLRSRR